ncbi:hypothetical protein ALP12_200304 [Pseudomonas savastanoi pv. phaseolicola]|uniref:hypothetical protein n=1 Tax=Pseudomonas savastanoi TaxID=29438 RepID=UPI0006B9D496|nr:hypothetical protein [Pseudomonas savastanoi]KPB43502.1 Uncharacterized protein AC515_1015 [Pseudomonas savastanoi pv. phaseolicola]RMV27321.1 hypothetical protein ALP12_200304 [Pseudomonas savastanoi pv. phaseolicola]
MSFGVISINESSFVQIDSETPRLCVLTKGSYSGTTNANVTFPRAVTSADPPLVFIRPDQNGIVQVPISVWFTGGPGNWTGFAMKASNVQSTLSGQYFIAAWASMGTASFGMRIWGAGGELVYDSGAPPVVVTFAAGNWTYVGSEQLSVGQRYRWSIDKALGVGEFISINSFAFHCHNGSNGGGCAIGVDYANSKIMLYSLATTAWTDQGHRPFLCAKLTA